MKSMGRSKQTRGVFSFHAMALSVLGLSLALVSACNEHTPLGSSGGPEFRGITVPLPPPSFRGATFLDMEFTGQVRGTQSERILAWDSVQKQGIAGAVDPAGNFRLPPWSVNVQKHCIELRSADSLGHVSSASYYSMIVATGPACQDSHCSVQDSKAECLCLTRRSANCVDEGPLHQAGEQGSSEVLETGSDSGAAVETGSGASADTSSGV